ncbi:hypothetical protein, partial [Brevibacillus nitrificans]|uniref:hypothetical protein n=1 Tax=Brevibacillus nitrificans TaxID=651560 RepID=UPI00285B6448
SNKVCIWFKAGKSLNDRLINAFAVQFSKSIFVVSARGADLLNYIRSCLKNQGLFLEVQLFFILFKITLKSDKTYLIKLKTKTQAEITMKFNFLYMVSTMP